VDQALRSRRAAGAIVARRELFERLSGAARVTVVSAPAGSGKTWLLRSWIAEAGLADRVGWVSVPREEHDPQRFWISVLDALRDTRSGGSAVRALTPSPDLDRGAIAERLLEDIGSLDDPLWLVIDDLQELRSDGALRQLALLLMRAPPELRCVLSTRSDLRLGLHRLRLEGELTELRADDLRFSLDQARALFEAAGVRLPETALAQLHQRTEGWCAGLRLAALAMAGKPDPERFAAEFGGSERTVAEYLVAEVLERQPEVSRQLLLRTSILERVNGPLADLLTGRSGGQQILQELEEAGAFVMSLDARRTWFRYAQMFAELLESELRQTAPASPAALHDAAAGWFAAHGHPVEAIRHAQAAGHWNLAVRLLSDHWFTLQMTGQEATAHALLARFPSDVVAVDPELPVLVAADEMMSGSLAEAERRLASATHRASSVPAERRPHVQALLAGVRLGAARRRTDLAAIVEEALRILAPTAARASAELEPEVGEELRAVVLAHLGVAELWTGRLTDAEHHLEHARALAHRIGRPYVEVLCLAHRAVPLLYRSFKLARCESMEAIERAREHGWGETPVAGIAYTVLGAILVWQADLDEAQRYLDRAQRALRAELDPAAGLALRLVRGHLEMVSGRDQEALATLTAAVRLDQLLATPHALAAQAHALRLQAMLRLGETGRVERNLAELDDELRETAEMRVVFAELRLAQDDAEGAAAALAPVLDGSVAVPHPAWLIEPLLLEAIARDALADTSAAGRALERALDLAEPDGLVWPFLFHPAPELLERHSRHHTTHASMVSEIRTQLGDERRASPLRGPGPLLEPLSESEARVLRYLPTNLSAPEIALELYVAVSTVKTHIHHIYGKLGVHGRSEAVERARALGLLAPSSLRAA
jgi:LuxR family transcriptional regulator, maltose regulon positive regulatory protein